MPPSQLKQLKASLRDSGVVAPQKSKKQKRQNAKTGAGAQDRIRRNAALEAIRDRFNPFEIKTTASRAKFDVTTRDGGSKSADKNHRPGVTKSLGEVRRRETLLREMNRKNKVGGLVDRRIGENDPTMTPEERAAERFARESERRLRKESMFNLEEDDEEEEFQLTHKGQSLSFGDGAKLEDYSDNDAGLDEEDSDSELPHKRKRVFEDEDGMGSALEDEGEEGLPERKKSKHEVMKEVIAKSKFHKLERQQAKEDDDDLREELDKELPDLFGMLRGIKPPPKPEPPKDDLAAMNPERAAWIEAGPGKDTEKEYDQRLRQMTFDQRSKPTDRTKTEEEKIEEEAQRLKALEEERLRRMRGEESSEDESEKGNRDDDDDDDMGASDDESVFDDAKAFGFQAPADHTSSRPELAVEDEDDFIIDDDLVETRSDVSLSIGGSDDEASSIEDSESEEEDAQEDEHINGLTIPEGKSTITADGEQTKADGLAYTYPCPSDHEEFLDIIKDVAVQDLPTVVQRIRALHHPRLASANKSKLGRFSAILVQHVAYMANQAEHPPFAVLENILRHIHSLAKSHPEDVSQAFRRHLRQLSAERPLNPLPGDLVILTGIFAIFPTSDHFHAIATPAHLTLARYLGQSTVNSLAEISTGTYAASLFLQYQEISKRYMPEFINYVLNALCNLCPKAPTTSLGPFPTRSPEVPLRLKATKSIIAPRTLRFWDITGPAAGAEEEELKLSLLSTLIKLLDTASDLWSDKSAFTEIFTPAHAVLTYLDKTWPAKLSKTALQATLTKVTTHLSTARLHRRPLELHHHRPLAIKTAIPKFEETFNPDKHYDPNRERAELNRVKAEYKRERKGAMRELRKDANFVAREQLRQKKERDAEYERKYRRLVAEVQNEEGREANAYEREKRLRQGKR